MATAVKSGNNFSFTGTGNVTLTQFTNDIADTTFVENMGSGVFRIKCTVARTLYIPENVKLTVGIGETLEIYTNITGANAYFALFTYAPTSLENTGGIFEMLEGSTFNGLTSDSGANTYNLNWQISGGLNIVGTSGSRITIKYLRNILFPYASSGVNQGRYIKDDVIVQYVDFDYHRIATQLFIFQHHFRISNINISNIRLFNTPATVSPIFISAQGYYPNMLISNITIGDSPATTAIRWMFGNVIVAGKFKDITLEANKWRGNTYNIYGGAMTQLPAMTSLYESNISIKETNQNYAMFENITFNDQSYTYYAYLNTNNVWVLKDCVFNATERRFVIYNNAKLLLWNTTHTTSLASVGDNGGAVAQVYGLDLTIQDLDNNPIADALVSVKQKDGYEKYYFKTDSNGKIDDIYGYNVCLCSNKVSNAQGTVFWSDDSNSSYHTVTVMKEGYKAETFNVVMDQDRIQTVQLKSLNKMYIGITEITGIGV